MNGKMNLTIRTSHDYSNISILTLFHIHKKVTTIWYVDKGRILAYYTQEQSMKRQVLQYRGIIMHPTLRYIQRYLIICNTILCAKNG